jgi:hypothetical protein
MAQHAFATFLLDQGEELCPVTAWLYSGPRSTKESAGGARELEPQKRDHGTSGV